MKKILYTFLLIITNVTNTIEHCDSIRTRYYKPDMIIEFINKHILPPLITPKDLLKQSTIPKTFISAYNDTLNNMIRNLTIQNIDSFQEAWNALINLDQSLEKKIFESNHIKKTFNLLKKLRALVEDYPYSGCERLVRFDSHAALSYCKKYLPNNPIILEAGAYDGTDTILMNKFWPNSIIHAFEPIPSNYDQLVNNVMKLKSKTIFTYDYALGTHNGILSFFTSELPGEPGVITQSSSFLKPKEHYDFAPHTFSNKINVNAVTIKNWMKQINLKKIDFLWLDLQGATIPTLEASQEILRDVKVIFSEANFVEAYEGEPSYLEMTQWFEDRGFVVAAITFSPEQPFLDKNAMKINDVWFSDIVLVREDLYERGK